MSSSSGEGVLLQRKGRWTQAAWALGARAPLGGWSQRVRGGARAVSSQGGVNCAPSGAGVLWEPNGTGHRVPGDLGHSADPLALMLTRLLAGRDRGSGGTKPSGHRLPETLATLGF